MTEWVAFLRAVNVAGKPWLLKDQVCKAFEAAGCRRARVCVSGMNVLFETRGASIPEKPVARELGNLAGAKITILYRSRKDIETVARSKPFGKSHGNPRLKLWVVFLKERPRKRPALPLVSPKDGLELIAVKGREAYVLSQPKKTGLLYGFPNAFVEDALGTVATSRQWSTIAKVAAAFNKT